MLPCGTHAMHSGKSGRVWWARVPRLLRRGWACSKPGERAGVWMDNEDRVGRAKLRGGVSVACRLVCVSSG